MFYIELKSIVNTSLEIQDNKPECVCVFLPQS